METAAIVEFFLAELQNNENRKGQLLALDHLPLLKKILSESEISEQVAPALLSLAKNSDAFLGEEVLRRLAERAEALPEISAEILVSLALHVDEPAVRDVAVAKLAGLFAHKTAEEKISLVSKFGPSEAWAFGPRMALAQLLGFAEISGEISDRARREISALVQDESPMIRRAAAKTLVSAISRATNFVPEISDLLADLRRMASDADEELRMQAVHACTEIRKNFRSSEVVLPIVARLVADSSAKIRRRAIEQWRDEEGSVWEISAAISDSDAEVRRLAVQAVTPAALDARAELLASVLSLAMIDKDVAVRATCVEKLGEWWASSGSAEVEELLRKILTEAGNAHFSVKLAAARAVLNLRASDAKLVSEVASLMNDPNWRVREFVVKNFARLAEKDKSVVALFPAAFTDTVSAVRDQAVEMVGSLMEISGPVWIHDTLIGKIKELFNLNHAYYHRLVAVRVAAKLKDLLSAEDFQTSGLMDAVLLPATKDPVPNVQICGQRVLGHEDHAPAEDQDVA